MTLALLLTAVTGAWAQTAFGVKEITADMLPASWSTDNSAVTADDLAKLGFMEVTKDAAKTWTGAPQEGIVRLIYTLCESVNWDKGQGGSESTYSSRKVFYSCLNGQRIFITTELTEWELKPDADKKVWTLAKMPANNIELQVEYYAESNLFLSKEALADKANIAVKNGETAVTFDDADKSANTITEGNTVTVTYTGTKKIIGVKAEKKKAAKPDLLPAVFTVDAGKTVKFSKGNLQATYDGSSWTWAFANNQWDYIGNAAGNTSINGNGTVSANGTVDLFGWVGASSTWTGAAQYGISNSTATNNVDGYGNVAGEAQKVGWGATVGTGWRTLTRPEWLYLLSTRETGITVNSTDNARYTQATINTDGTAVKGLIIFPDSYAGGSPAGVTWGTINAKSTFETTCTSAGWTALEAAGCVFLPAAGYREASTVTDAGVGGGYWSSSSSYATSAFGLYFESNSMTIQFGGSRKYGFSVRLVRDAN